MVDIQSMDRIMVGSLCAEVIDFKRLGALGNIRKKTNKTYHSADWTHKVMSAIASVMTSFPKISSQSGVVGDWKNSTISRAHVKVVESNTSSINLMRSWAAAASRLEGRSLTKSSRRASIAKKSQEETM